MSRRILDLLRPNKVSGFTSITRRDFLGGMGDSVQSCLFPFCCRSARALQAVQRPSHPPNRKSPLKPAAAAGFSFKDIAKEAGLAGAVNVFGGIERKQYILEETGCGVALFDYDNDGWLDIFMVNGTRFEGISTSHPPTQFSISQQSGWDLY